MTIRSVLRLALVGLAAFPLAFHAGDASAAPKKGKAKASAPAPPKKKSIALGAFRGNKTKEIRGWVEEALRDDFVVTDAEDFKPKNTEAGYEKMASDLGVDAVIVGKVEQQRLVLTIRGTDGAIIKELVVKAPRGPRLKRAIDGGVSPAVGKAVGSPEEEEEEEEEEAPEEKEPPKAAPAPAPAEDAKEGAAEEAQEEKAEEPEPEPEPEPPGNSGPPFVAELGVRFLNRKLSFNDTLTQLDPVRPLWHEAYIMRDYELRLDPMIYVHAQLYPAALFGGEGFISNLGLVGGFEQGIPITSKYAGNLPDVPKELKNNTQEWFFGPRVRIPGSSSEFGIELTYGKHSFILEGDEKFPIVPDTKYGYIRLGADAAFSLGKLYLGLDLGVRLVLSTGELQSVWFENAAGKGLDVGIHVGYELIPAMSIVAGGNMTRYGFDFNPIARDEERVAGGAIDQYLSGFVGARFVLGGGASSKGFGLATAAVTVTPKSAPKEEAEEPADEEPADEEPADEESADEESAE